MYAEALSHHLQNEDQAFCLVLLHTLQRTRYPEHKYTSFLRNHEQAFCLLYHLLPVLVMTANIY